MAMACRTRELVALSSFTTIPPAYTKSASRLSLTAWPLKAQVIDPLSLPNLTLASLLKSPQTFPDVNTCAQPQD